MLWDGRPRDWYLHGVDPTARAIGCARQSSPLGSHIVSEIVGHVFYAPGFQMPVALACTCLIAAVGLPSSSVSDASRTLIAACAAWFVLMLWFRESGATFKGVWVLGLALGLLLAFYAWVVLALRRTLVGVRTRLAVAVLVALIVSFAAPVLVITVSCAFGDCL
jgi:hypothetical protein